MGILLFLKRILAVPVTFVARGIVWLAQKCEAVLKAAPEAASTIMAKLLPSETQEEPTTVGGVFTKTLKATAANLLKGAVGFFLGFVATFIFPDLAKGDVAWMMRVVNFARNFPIIIARKTGERVTKYITTRLWSAVHGV